MYIRHGVKIAKNLQVKIKKEKKSSLIIYNLIIDLSKLQGDFTSETMGIRLQGAASRP